MVRDVDGRPKPILSSRCLLGYRACPPREMFPSELDSLWPRAGIDGSNFGHQGQSSRPATIHIHWAQWAVRTGARWFQSGPSLQLLLECCSNQKRRVLSARPVG